MGGGVMAWIESHQELGTHPKLLKLARVLHVGKPCAIGYLHYLWWWAVDYAPEGDLSKFEALDIAIGGEWEGEPEVFVEALVRCGFLDETEGNGLVIHDWESYAGKLIDRRERNAERMREARAEQRETRAPNVQRTQPARAKLPNLTKPNQTKSTYAQAAFDRFWAAYPKRRAKDRAESAWNKIKPDDETIKAILDAVEAQKQSRDWTKDGGQFIPYPATWLNDGGWKDAGVDELVDRRRSIVA
jgi:hypothetical protein